MAFGKIAEKEPVCYGNYTTDFSNNDTTDFSIRGTMGELCPPSVTPKATSAPLSIRVSTTGSGRRGSNPRPSAWKADALPTELLPQFGPFFKGDAKI